MAATLRAPARAALASSSSRRARCRSSRRTLAASASASPRGSDVEVITFDLDDTLWPTTPVVMAANQAFVDFCQERIPGFPDCAGVNEYMKVSARAAPAGPNFPDALARNPVTQLRIAGAGQTFIGPADAKAGMAGIVGAPGNHNTVGNVAAQHIVDERRRQLPNALKRNDPGFTR